MDNGRFSPPTKEQREAAEAAYQERMRARGSAVGPSEYTFLPSVESRATGWYTIPKPIRFAVWLWAILSIIGLASAVVGACFWVLAIVLALGQM